MRVNINYLKKFINLDDLDQFKNQLDIKELFGSIGIEVDEVFDSAGAQTFEVEITPNRPDWLSHFGLAREIYAKLPQLKITPPQLYPLGTSLANETFAINIQDGRDCGRYTGCIVRNITVGQSSEPIKALIESFGFRPINNIVDISNLTMMTLGQPIHIFDLDCLKGSEINTRRAKSGEKMILLDESTVELTGDNLVIADRETPVALAGVMGGLESGVTDSTRNILIESAYFNPAVIRKSARKLGLSTDASFRFERGGDILVTKKAIEFTLALLRETQKNDLEITFLGDPFPQGYTPQIVEISPSFPGQYTGIPIEPGLSRQILENLGFKVEEKGEVLQVEVPSFRVDIYGKQDLVEEIIRVYGYDKLESHLPQTANQTIKIDKGRDIIRQTGNFLTAAGFNEVYNYSFHTPEENRYISADENFIEIKNPIGKDFSVMRNSLLPGLLRSTVLNFNNGAERVTLFETGGVFSRGKDNQPIEKRYLGISAAGVYTKRSWLKQKPEEVDFFIFKSILSALFDSFFITCKFVSKEWKHLKPACSFAILLNGEEAGYAGEFATDRLNEVAFKLEKPLYIAEIDLSQLVQHQAENRFTPWNKYPSSRRDFSFLIGRAFDYARLEEEIGQFKPGELETYELMDRYEGPNIPADKISLSMSFAYRSKEKTLTNEEVNSIHNEFVKRLKDKLDLVQR